MGDDPVDLYCYETLDPLSPLSEIYHSDVDDSLSYTTASTEWLGYSSAPPSSVQSISSSSGFPSIEDFFSPPAIGDDMSPIPFDDDEY
jgi:hypothetical protein